MTFRTLVQMTIAIVVALSVTSIQAEDQNSARWEKAITAFEAKAKDDPPPNSAVLFAGSSSIRLWDLDKYFPDTKTINRGFGGSEIADSTHFADRIILPHKPKAIVLYAGDNDVARGKSAKQVAGIVESLCAAGSNALVTRLDASKAAEQMGADHVEAPVTQAVVDERQRFVTAPAYMEGQAKIHEVAQGIGEMVTHTLALVPEHAHA